MDYVDLCTSEERTCTQAPQNRTSTTFLWKAWIYGKVQNHHFPTTPPLHTRSISIYLSYNDDEIL